MSKPAAYRCSRCDVDWPSSTTYKDKCAVCGGEVWLCVLDAGAQALTTEQARALILRAEAERDVPESPEPEVAEDVAPNYTPRQLYVILKNAKQTLKALPVAHRWDIPMEERCAEYDPDAGAAYDG